MKTHKTKNGTELPILALRGKDYLEVKFRLVWFHEERPDWSIQTSFLEMTDNHAVARAEIRDQTGRIMSTSHKFEDFNGFPDFREKAETGAIGRALALIGYGTQFTGDELDEGHRIVDAPVQRNPDKYKPTQPTHGKDGSTTETHYRIGFGMYKGKTLEELGVEPVKKYVAYLDNARHKEPEKPISPQVAEFFLHAENYLQAMDTQVPVGQNDVPKDRR